MNNHIDNIPEGSNSGKMIRAGLNVASGFIPFAGGFLAAVSGAWSEHEQEKLNNFFKNWLQMLQDELKEKEKTIIEIVQRLDLTDEKISERIKSPEYQSIVKKCFRGWSGIETEKKREYVRSILANAAITDLSTDDLVKLFLDWVNQYSEFHFQVIACIYQHSSRGISRGEIWDEIGKKKVREDSADADLYKLLIRDLSTGGIIRQHRPTDYQGNFIKRPNQLKKVTNNTNQMTSAFDRIDLYVLTSLGKDFVHYAMNDIPIKIEYNPDL